MVRNKIITIGAGIKLQAERPRGGVWGHVTEEGEGEVTCLTSCLSVQVV